MIKKIIIAFTLSLVIPIIVMFTLISVLDSSTLVENYLTSDIVLNNQKIEDIEKVESNISKIFLKIEENYASIKDYDTFYKKVFQDNQEYVSNIQIVNTNGRILFDALSKDNVNENVILNEDEIKSFDTAFNKRQQDLNKVSEDIRVDDEVVATALITMKINMVSYFKKFFYILFAIFIFSFLLLVLLIVLFAFRISKGISEPIKLLKSSAEGIVQGNFDIDVNYRAKNDIGKFCENFDKMRIELRDSFSQKERYEESRKELFACISHDLRTPITSIKSYVEGLEKGLATTKEKHDRYLKVIQNKTNVLDKMIDDIFCLSQLEIGKFPINFLVEYSDKMLKDILSTFEIEFKDSPIEFKINEPIPSVKVKCDRKRIFQVILNIIENAKKYISHGGMIKISTNITDNFLIISIEDNGTGINPEQIPYVFDVFFTGEISRTKKHSGSGLGLAICKQIILAHGGDIWVESKVDLGTTFYLSLPLENI